MTVGDLLRVAMSVLQPRPGLAQPGREARAMLACLLERDEAWVIAHPESGVETRLAAVFERWLERRAGGEPFHHLVGACPFWGRVFAVGPAVLVPRPETELVVSMTLGLGLPDTPRVLDVGTGSGCLAITLALEVPGAVVTATDASLAALAVARRNAVALGARVALIAADLAAPLAGAFDLVVANLPYVPTGDIDTLAPEVRNHDPRPALDGGPDGLSLLRRFLPTLPDLLVPGAYALLEIGPGQAAALDREGLPERLVKVGVERDLGGVERALALRRV
ncbi:MAG: peptide chain release factor N(5)-glutamine methyltransferase [Acidobacteriota bacterium]